MPNICKLSILITVLHILGSNEMIIFIRYVCIDREYQSKSYL